MAPPDRQTDPGAPPPAGFHTTRWSVVQHAARPGGAGAERALAELCAAYWYPLYAYVRRSGRSVHAARDLTQAFFVRLLEKREFARADPARGPFRAFLLKGLEFSLHNEADRAGALVRGGGLGPTLSLDFEGADGRYALEPSDELSPERIFQRSWALELLDRAHAALAEEYAGRGKQALFGALRPALTGDCERDRATLARELGLSEGALKVAIHRLRRRFGECLRREIADTVTGPEEVEAELAELLDLLGGTNS